MFETISLRPSIPNVVDGAYQSQTGSEVHTQGRGVSASCGGHASDQAALIRSGVNSFTVPNKYYVNFTSDQDLFTNVATITKPIVAKFAQS